MIGAARAVDRSGAPEFGDEQYRGIGPHGPEFLSQGRQPLIERAQAAGQLAFGAALIGVRVLDPVVSNTATRGPSS